jgi:tetratricopeptide (TPR) repeat protein
MKTNDFGLLFWQNRLLMFFASTLFLLFSTSQTPAQPGDCRSNNWRLGFCRERRDALLQKSASEIENLDRQIASDPKNPVNYYQRGLVYSTLIDLRLSGARDVVFDGKVYFADVEEKAIADFTRAIQIAPRVEYHVERGKIYFSQWERETTNFQYVRRGDKHSDEEILQTIDKLFLYNEVFQAAEKDFLKGIELSENYETSRNARDRLYTLRNRRALSLNISESIADLIGGGKAADIALADFDDAIEFYRFYLANNQREEHVKKYVYDAWIQKGAAAKRFGRDDIALEAFRQAEKVQVKNSYPVCALYQDRAEIFVKRANLDAALRDVAFAIENNLNCKRMNELRGDIYLVKGDLTSAIDSYSVILNEKNGFDRDVYWKRGKVYLQISEPQKAIDDFTAAINYSGLCEKDYQLRAAAHRLAGDTQAAEADEERARQALKDQKLYTGSDYCHYHKN